MNKLMCGIAAFVAGALLVGTPAMSQPPGGKDDKGGKGGFPGGPGGRGGVKIGTVIPPFAVEQLKLTDDQKTQLAALEADVKAKLEKMLTPEQLKTLESPRPGGFGGAGGFPGRPGGDKGAPGGRPGFPGGKGGPPGEKAGKGERPPV